MLTLTKNISLIVFITKNYNCIWQHCFLRFTSKQWPMLLDIFKSAANRFSTPIISEFIFHVKLFFMKDTQ